MNIFKYNDKYINLDNIKVFYIKIEQGGIWSLFADNIHLKSFKDKQRAESDLELIINKSKENK